MAKKTKSAKGKKHKKSKSHSSSGSKDESPNAEDSMHVLVPTPKNLQKDVLTGAIDVIKLLKHHKKYNEIGKKKAELHEKLKEIVTEIKHLEKDLRADEMPISLAEILEHPRFKKVEVPKPKAKKKEAPEPKAEKKPKPSLPRDKLESDLAALRDKLSQL